MTKSPVNNGIMNVIAELKQEIRDYDRIELAYVYETSSLMSVKSFEVLNENTQQCYKEPCNRTDTHDLSHVFFMGMAMLRLANKDENADYRLYLVTDEAFERVNEIVWQSGNHITAADYVQKDDDANMTSGIIMNPGFEDVNAQLILVRPELAGGDIFEKYFERSGKGRIIVL